MSAILQSSERVEEICVEPTSPTIHVPSNRLSNCYSTTSSNGSDPLRDTHSSASRSSTSGQPLQRASVSHSASKPSNSFIPRNSSIPHNSSPPQHPLAVHARTELRTESVRSEALYDEVFESTIVEVNGVRLSEAESRLKQEHCSNRVEEVSRLKQENDSSRVEVCSTSKVRNHSDIPSISKSSAHIRLRRQDQLRILSPIVAPGAVSASQAQCADVIAAEPAAALSAATTSQSVANTSVPSASAAAGTSVPVTTPGLALSGNASVSVAGSELPVESSRLERVERSRDTGSASDSGDEVFLTGSPQVHVVEVHRDPSFVDHRKPSGSMERIESHAESSHERTDKRSNTQHESTPTQQSNEALRENHQEFAVRERVTSEPDTSRTSVGEAYVDSPKHSSQEFNRKTSSADPTTPTREDLLVSGTEGRLDRSSHVSEAGSDDKRSTTEDRPPKPARQLSYSPTPPEPARQLSHSPTPPDGEWLVASQSFTEPQRSDILKGTDGRLIVVAIDFGTTFSGYAFSFVHDTSQSIYVMRKWEGGDPGIVNQKTPTVLLLNPAGEFHSFGFTARDFYHDLSAAEAKRWMFFDRFKMSLHYTVDLNRDTTVCAANGKPYPALKVFAHALRYFKDLVLQELSDQSETDVGLQDIRWVVTVPAIWKQPAKQFMRQAAYDAGLASEDCPSQLLIALEPEVASIYMRKLRMYQLAADTPLLQRPLSTYTDAPTSVRPQSASRGDTLGPRTRVLGASKTDDDLMREGEEGTYSYNTFPSVKSSRRVTVSGSHTLGRIASSQLTVGQHINVQGLLYMIVDCGGGTVDITVHQMDSTSRGGLKEVYKATGGPYGSAGVDAEFERLLVEIFGSEFIRTFRSKRPAGWVDLMMAFESRKRAASPSKTAPLNVSLPFSFIDYYKKHAGSTVEIAIKKYGNDGIRWSTQGMLRLSTQVMRNLFLSTLAGIRQAIGDVLNAPTVKNVQYMFVVGGFAESAILQTELRKEFNHILKVLIPQEVSLVVLKGAVLFGLDPSIVEVRRSRLTYGLGVLNRYDPVRHPLSKLWRRDGVDWCTDVLDSIVIIDQPIALGDTVVRSYTPAKPGQKSILIHVYCSERPDVTFTSDPGVRRCGTLCLDLSDLQYRVEDSRHVNKTATNKSTAEEVPGDVNKPATNSSTEEEESRDVSKSATNKRREIQARLTFGDTEVHVSAVDVCSGKCVRASIDFLSK